MFFQKSKVIGHSEETSRTSKSEGIFEKYPAVEDLRDFEYRDFKNEFKVWGSPKFSRETADVSVQKIRFLAYEAIFCNSDFRFERFTISASF